MQRKVTAVVTALIMIISLCACSNSKESNSTETIKPTAAITEDIAKEAAATIIYNKTYEEEEIEQAKALGIIPDGMSLSGDISGEDFISLLSNMIELFGGDVNAFTDKAHSSDGQLPTVNRKEAAIGFYLATNAMGLDNRYSNGIGGLWIQDADAANESPSEMFDLPETVTIIVDDYDEQEYPPILAALLYCVQSGSVVSKNTIMTTDDENNFNPMSNITAKDAALGAWRLYTSVQEPIYASLEEAAKDTNTISKEIYGKESSLPDIAYGNIPKYNAVTYQGKGNAYGFGSPGYFDEDLVHALSDAGVNFISAWFDFSTLQYPDFKDGQINLNELKELDQLISWCIEYDVHICIEMTGVPNHGGYPRGLACYDPSVYSYGGMEDYEGAGGLNPYIKQNNLQNIIQRYWELLAKRYEEVPAKYLSFNLQVEIGLDDEQEFVDTYLPLAEAIRSYNNDRVVFCYANVNKVFDGLAAYGYPLAYSFYAPSQLTLSGESEDYPYYDAKWPTYNLNGVLVGSEKESESSLQLTLNSDMTSVKIHARNTDGEAQVNVKADGKKLSVTKTEDDNGWYFLESELPSDTSVLKLSVKGDCAVEFDAIFLTNADGSNISINPYQFNYPTQEKMTVITVAEDGSITSNQELNFETLINEQDYLGEYIKIADKYDVGIIVSEWGIAADTIDADTETLYNYMKEMDEGFDALGITAASTSAPDLSTRSVILTKRCAAKLYESQGSIDFDRYKALDYSSKYYIDTYLAEMLY